MRSCRPLLLSLLFAASACASGNGSDPDAGGGVAADASSNEEVDAASSTPDADLEAADASAVDAGPVDAAPVDAALADAELPDASPPDASPVDAAPEQCDPLQQTGCGVGEKCAQLIDTNETRTDCVADGDVAKGGACFFGQAGPDGFDDCVAGLACINGICQDICTTNPNSCDTGEACTEFIELFDEFQDVGACQPTCDPVAQDCANSADACYINAVTAVATCTPPATGAANVGQDETCVGPAAGQCFLNGCGKGFEALIDDDPVNPTTQVCTFFCNPDAANAAGDPNGVTCLDGPGAGYDCRFLQSFYGNTGDVPANVGFCINTSLWGSCANDSNLPGCAPL